MNPIKKIISKSARLFGYAILPLSSVIDQEDLFDECTYFLKQFKKLVILDVGAYQGNFSEKAARKFPNASIYAFEPQKSDFLILKSNMSRLKNVKVINKALSNITGEKTLFVTSGSASSSFLKSKGNLYPEQNFIGEERVKTVTLTDWTEQEGIEFIHLLKLDTQGYELEILKHSGDIFKKIYSIFSEIHFQHQYNGSTDFFELSNFLFSRGFRLINIYNIRRLNKRAIYSDGLYVREDLLTSLENLEC